jgi:flavin reductase (DIM6/NTAB) family NADH-FMN oxidoreductase RutF
VSSAPEPSPSVPTPAPDLAAFRRVAGRFATGVCVLTAVDGGFDHAMTANAFTTVSLDPMLVLACVETEARFHDAVISAGEWAVSILDAESRRVSDWLASRGRPLVGQLDRIPFHRGPVTGAALIEGSLGWLECRTTAVHPGGDHSILVAEVVSLEVGPAHAQPLLYFRSAYHKLG